MGTLALGYILAMGFALPPGLVRAGSLNLIRIDVPPPEHPRPTPRPAERDQSQGKASPPNLRAEATQIVAPPPELPLPIPSPIPAAPIAGSGPANAAGSADVPGPGTGAGGQGNGRGSGSGGAGEGDGAGGTPPQWIKGRIKDSDYPKSAGEAAVSGAVSVRYTVEVDGHATNCRVTTSSGNAELDATTCQLIEKRFRFRPSRDEEGMPVRATIVENHTWVIDRVANAAEPDHR